MQARNKIAVSIIAISLLSGLTGAPGAARPQKLAATPAPAAHPSSDTAIHARLAELRKAVVAGDAHAMASLWTEDCRYTDEDGKQYKGRKEVEAAFTSFLSEGDRLPVEIVADSVSFPATGVAIVDGTVKKAPSATAKPVPVNRFNMAFVQKNGQWQIASSAEVPISSALPANPLESLEWLLGKWSAERNGSTVKLEADWAPGKHFIRCTYTVQKQGQDPLEEIQVIGWDPQRGQPVSWLFDANGGYGKGIWTRSGNRWLIEMNSVQQDGSTMSVTDVISDMQPGGFSWQSVNRRLEGVLLEDAAPLKIQRLAHQN